MVVLGAYQEATTPPEDRRTEGPSKGLLVRLSHQRFLMSEIPLHLRPHITSQQPGKT